MKIAVIGSRTFSDYSLLKNTLNDFTNPIDEIISGGAEGADKLAEIYATENEIRLSVFKPDWAKFGRAAGVIRNKEIIFNADYCFAFWDGKSKGTATSIHLCKKLKKPHQIILTKIS
jgi:hypothetical protein